jgi:hypothetical protein
MLKLGLAHSGPLTALAFAILLSTSAVAQQPAPTPDTPKASPTPSTPEATPAPAKPQTASPAAPSAGDESRDKREGALDRDRWSRGDRRDYDDYGERARRRYYDRDDFGWDDRGPRRGYDERRRGWDNHGARGFGSAMGPRMPGLRMLASLCRPGGERMMGFLLESLERITEPTDAQRASFDKLKEAAGKAREIVRGACPTEAPPITPPGRLAAAEKRLEALLSAIRQLRPAMDEYYGSLSEEQKARLYASRGRSQWRHGFERWRRDRDWDRRGPDGPRRGWREGRGESRDDEGNLGRDRGREDSRGREDRRGDRDADRDPRRDTDRDGWPDRWHGRL